LFSHAKLKFMALLQIHDNFKSQSANGLNSTSELEVSQGRRLLEETQESLERQKMVLGVKVISRYSFDVSSCSGLEQELAAHIADCQDVFLPANCLDRNNIRALCDSDCVQRTWYIYDNLFEVAYNKKCNLSPISAGQLPLTKFSAGRPCSANFECCNREVCAAEGVCDLETCASAPADQKASCRQAYLNSAGSIDALRMMVTFNMACAMEHSSNDNCWLRLNSQFAQGKDYSCAQAQALGCCLPSYKYFLSNCQDSGLHPNMFGLANISDIDTMTDTCMERSDEVRDVSLETELCHSFRVRKRESDGMCHVILHDEYLNHASVSRFFQGEVLMAVALCWWLMTR